MSKKIKQIGEILRKGYSDSKQNDWVYVGKVNENTLPIGYVVDRSGNYVKYDYRLWEKLENRKQYKQKMIAEGWTYVPDKIKDNFENVLPIGTIIDPSRHFIKQDYEKWELLRREEEARYEPQRLENLKKNREEIEMIRIIDEYMNKLREQKRKKDKAISKKRRDEIQQKILKLEKDIKKKKEDITRYIRRKKRR